MKRSMEYSLGYGETERKACFNYLNPTLITHIVVLKACVFTNGGTDLRKNAFNVALKAMKKLLDDPLTEAYHPAFLLCM